MRLRRFLVSRAVVREMLPSFALAAGVSTFLLLVRSIFGLADLLMSRNVSGLDVLKLLALAIPHVAALTIPMGVLFAALMTAARAAGDSETVALQACGVRVSWMLRPLLAFAAVFFLVDLAITAFLVPWGNRAIMQLTTRVALSGARAAVEPRAFNEEFPGYLLYIDRIDREDNRWSGILLFDLSSTVEERLVAADAGTLVVNPRDGTAWLNLLETSTYVVRPDKPETAQVTENRELKILLSTPAATGAQRQVGIRATDSADLLQRVSDSSVEAVARREARVELQKRLAIPAATVVFALVGLPLGARGRRGGKGFSLAVSVFLIIAYYVLLNNGELLARSGKLTPFLGVWLPNLVLGLTGVVLTRKVVRGFSEEHVPGTGVLRWLREHVSLADRPEVVRTRSGRLRLRPSDADEEAKPVVSPLPSLFSILDGHVLRQCVGYFVLVLAAVCGIAIAVKLSEQISDIQRNHVPLMVVASYYLVSLPQLLHDILPISFLIAFLGTAAVLDRHNEATALKAAGVSLTRVSLPLLSLAAALGVALFVLDDSVVQRANRDAQRLDDVIEGRRVARSYRATDRPWLFLPDGRTLVNLIQYDPDTQTLLRPSVYVFGSRLNLMARYTATRATFENGHWRAEGAWSRKWFADGSSTLDKDLKELPLNVEPAYFGREYRKPSQMSFRELRDYLATLRTAGYRVDRQLVQLHQKLAYPASLMVLTWLALPFAFRGGRRGTVVSLATALILGMAYLAVTALVTKLGEASMLPPVLAAWTPTVVFALLAANRHTTLRT